MELKNRAAIITGSCGEGMGRSMALRLAREGANVVLNYGTHRRDKDVESHAEKIVRAITDLGGNAIVCPADTTDEGQVKKMVDNAAKEFGSVDILVNNAGGDWKARDLTEIPLKEWQDVLAAEINGAFLTMKYVLPEMRKRKWGRIIHIGLWGALRMEVTNFVAPDYCLGKAARAWMTTAFATQELPNGISVNCIEPGVIPHVSYDEAVAYGRGDSSAWLDRGSATCHDVAELLAFLCSEAGRFISGAIIPVCQKP